MTSCRALLSSAAIAVAVCALPAPARRFDIGPGRHGVDAALDCGLRALALDWAQFLQPSADATLVYDALRLGADCTATAPRRPAPAAARAAARPAAAGAFYVDALRGDDGAAGTQSAPFTTIARGLPACFGWTRRGRWGRPTRS